jgi:hypothetical protein
MLSLLILQIQVEGFGATKLLRKPCTVKALFLGKTLPVYIRQARVRQEDL